MTCQKKDTMSHNSKTWVQVPWLLPPNVVPSTAFAATPSTGRLHNTTGRGRMVAVFFARPRRLRKRGWVFRGPPPPGCSRGAGRPSLPPSERQPPRSPIPRRLGHGCGCWGPRPAPRGPAGMPSCLPTAAFRSICAPSFALVRWPERGRANVLPMARFRKDSHPGHDAAALALA